MQLVQDDEQIQSVHLAICLIIFGAHVKILFIIKIKIPCSLSGNIGPPIRLSIESLVRLAYFEHVGKSLLNACLFDASS